MSVDRIFAEIVRQSKNEGDRQFLIAVNCDGEKAVMAFVKADAHDGFAVFADPASKRHIYVPFAHISAVSPEWL